MTILSLRICTLTAIAIAGLWIAGNAPALSASTQSTPVEVGKNVTRSTAPASSNPIRDRFREGMQEYQGQLDQLAKDVQSLTKKLEKQSDATVEERKTEVDALRQKLTSLGSLIQPDSPLVAHVDRMEQWLAAQRTRLANRRANLGVEFVERLLKDYKEMEEEVAAAREQLNGGVKGIDSLLNELSQAQDRIAELLLAEDARAAVQELRQVVGDITKTIEAIRGHVKAQFNTPGA